MKNILKKKSETNHSCLSYGFDERHVWMGAGVGVESSIVVKAFGVGWTVACMDRDGRKTSEETIRMVHFYKGQGTRKKKAAATRQTDKQVSTNSSLSV